MEPVRRVEGVAVALPLANLDTDQIIPARFLKRRREEGYGDALFHDLRHDTEGSARPGFPLDDPARAGAKILVTRRGFGVGSSREAAVYALIDYGILCVIAPSFGDIFAGNAVNNGLIAAIVTEADLEELLEAVAAGGRVSVDLEASTIVAGNLSIGFAIDPVRRTKLLNGWDDLDLTLSHRAEIDAFAAADRARRPWAVPPSSPQRM
jgi:3-isopropylmalate/(R)-2-methylmalate dehydratase small subunit